MWFGKFSICSACKGVHKGAIWITGKYLALERSTVRCPFNLVLGLRFMGFQESEAFIQSRPVLYAATISNPGYWRQLSNDQT